MRGPDGLLVGIDIAVIFQYSPAESIYGAFAANALLVTGAILTAGTYMLCEVPSSFIASISGFPLIALAFGNMLVATRARVAFSTNDLFCSYLLHRCAALRIKRLFILRRQGAGLGSK